MSGEARVKFLKREKSAICKFSDIIVPKRVYPYNPPKSLVGDERICCRK